MGTTFLVCLLVVMGFNFASTSRWTGLNDEIKKQAPLEQIVPEKKEVKQEEEKSDEFETIQFVVKNNPQPAKKQKVDEPLKIEKETSKKAVDALNIHVLLYNHSGDTSVQKKVKETLEMRGFTVELGPQDFKVRGTTLIVDKKEVGMASKVRETIQVGQVRQELVEDEIYDVILAIGEDYLP